MNGNEVVETVDLRCFKKVKAPVPKGGFYNIMEVTQYKGACRLRLPRIISEELTTNNIDVHINEPGNIIVILPGGDRDFEISRRGESKVGCIYSKEIARSFEKNKINTPANFKVVKDERIGGWVCRKVD
jgi:hypothetical protein